MFTVVQIKAAHSKVKSGADFPSFIQEIKALGVISFETWVIDSHTEYSGVNNFKTSSKPMYDNLIINISSNKTKFEGYLKKHQHGETDYFTFCKHCAETGIEKWIVSIVEMTCTYYDSAGNNIMAEQIPQ